MLSDNPTLEELEEVFNQDRFAVETTGCRIIEGSLGHAVCELELADGHRNAQDHVMGGAIFTLCDFAIGIACNIGKDPAVAVESNISFMRSTKGTKLTATANCDKPGSHLEFFTVDVEDDLGKTIAKLTALCYR